MKKAIILAFAFLVSGCDPIWIQNSFVATDASSFPSCVKPAISGLKDVEIYTDASNSQRVALKTPYGTTEIRRAQNGTLEVRIIGWGFYEPASKRKVVTPFLASITTRLARVCGG